MNYAYTTFFAEDFTEEDDIDALFSQLQPIEPPDTLVDDIVASVARLGAFMKPRVTQILWDDMNLVEYTLD